MSRRDRVRWLVDRGIRELENDKITSSPWKGFASLWGSEEKDTYPVGETNKRKNITIGVTLMREHKDLRASQEAWEECLIGMQVTDISKMSSIAEKKK